ncbi:pyrimidine 5'-nucleotidase [Marinibaculum pumilum]|uniref:Pyrimidine 5'-nucleotidase n=1 Tax=Marinibaculum pumilum TaxID=1766165 RepID=A0ABV7L686_9PROT
MADDKRQALRQAAEAKVWIFDLDNTLYPAHCNLFDQIDRRMGTFIQNFLGIDAAEARALQKQYFRAHGTTMRGLMTHHGMDPQAFLDFVHDIDLSVLPAAHVLDEALARLPGRKIIFTNGSVRHAERITEHMGIDRHFEAIFDIVASDFVPKPDAGPYRTIVAQHGIDPAQAVMVEDIVRNLEPAAAMGMITVLVRPADAGAGAGAEAPPDYVRHLVHDLPDWLHLVSDTLAAPGQVPGPAPGG